MKRAFFSFLSFLMILSAPCLAEDGAVKNFPGSGEVLSVDPLYSRVTIAHTPIKDFSGGPETEFFVRSSSLLKGISPRDLVEFQIEEIKGDAQIIEIKKTGEAPPREEGVPVGRVVQDALMGTGELVKGVTQPLAPVGEVTSSVVGATTDATGSVLNDANPDVKQKF